MLRQDLTDAALELDRRVTRLLDFRSHGAKLADWGLRQVEERPQVVAGVGLAVATGITFVGVQSVRGMLHKPTRTEQLARSAEWAREEATSRLQDAISQAQAVMLAGAGAAHHHLAAAEKNHEPVQKESSMIKKLIWGAITAGSLALAGVVAQRVSTAIWRAVMHEEPPIAE